MTVTSPAITVAQPPRTVEATEKASGDACASASKTALDAALKANAQISGALAVDSNGLKDIKCAAPWAVASFSNNIDGGSVVFNYQNGAWVAKNGGTDVCEDVPAAIAKQICG